MSHRYGLTVNVSTDTIGPAVAASRDVESLIDEKCIVEQTSLPFRLPGDVYEFRVMFRAANDAEAADLAHRVSTLPGLPPLDAIKWRRLSEVSAR